MEDAFYSIGDSYSSTQGCYSLAKTVYIVDGELTLQPIELLLDVEDVHLKADRRLYVQYTTAPKRTLCSVDSSNGSVMPIPFIEDFEKDDFDGSPFDDPDEFRVVTPNRIYCVNSLGEERVLLKVLKGEH